MTIKEKAHSSRPAASRIPSSRVAAPRIPRTSRRDAARRVRTPEESAEQGWFIFVLALFLALGIGFIGAISYIVLLG